MNFTNSSALLLESPSAVKSRCTRSFTSRIFSKMRTFLKSYKALALIFIIVLLFAAISRAYNGFGYSHIEEKTTSFARRYLDFGIMFDAGSTGSRIHVYAFQKADDGTLKLVDEVFEQTKPGLSSFAHYPKEGAKTIAKLLDIGKDVIPPTKWHETPVALKATAGLRLLPPKASKGLLDEVYKVLKDSPFKVSGTDSVSIMDGLYEGIYAWVTVNFLTGRFSNKGSSLFGALDLGGGSTQITFHPMDKDTIPNSPKGFTKSTEVFGHTFSLYSHSYLGLGLMSARAAISRFGKNSIDTNEKNVSKTPCLAPFSSGKWEFGGKTNTVSGHANYSFGACMNNARSLVKPVDRQDEMNSRIFYTFSYFYDRAADLNLIDVKKGGVITVGDFVGKAEEVCSSTKVRPNKLACMDATYISALLKHGYGLHNDRKLILRKKINKVEVSWALGATLDMLSKESKSST